MIDALSPERLWKEFRRALAIAGKDVRIYCLKPPVLLFGVVFPFFLFLSFYIGSRGPIADAIPGLVAISLFFTATNIAPAGMPFERMTKTFNRFITAPISLSWVVFGKTLAGFAFGALVSVLPLLVGVFAFGTVVADLLLLIFALLLAALSFSCMGTLFAAIPTDVPGYAMMVLNFVRLPLLFVSGVFVSLASMPGWARGISVISPLTYANDLIRGSLGYQSYHPYWLDFLAVFLFGVAFYVAALWIFNASRRRA